MARDETAIHPRRMVYLDGAVDATMLRLRKDLTDLFNSDSDKPILLVITSPGGLVSGGFALMDRIQMLQRSGAKIHCLVEGQAMSMGLLIMQVCDTRLMGPNALLMVHGISWGVQGDITDHEALLDMADKSTRRAVGLLSRRTGRGDAYWRKRLQSNRPVFYTPAEALALGLVDEVLEDV